jgi:hypothetical protein
VFQACYANPHDHHPTHFRVSLFPLIHSPRRWQHARGLRLALAFIRPALATRLGVVPRIGIHSPSVGNTLGGYASNWHSFVPALATRSGAAPRIGIPSPQRWQHARELRLEFAFLRPSVGNTLGGCASNWHSFAPVLVRHSGALPSNPMLAMLGGYAYMLTSTVFTDINCTPSATSTSVRGIRHLPARRQ